MENLNVLYGAIKSARCDYEWNGNVWYLDLIHRLVIDYYLAGGKRDCTKFLKEVK